jgi:hypothetical protein
MSLNLLPIQLLHQARLKSGALISMNNPLTYCPIYITYGQHRFLLRRFFPGISRTPRFDHTRLNTAAHQAIPQPLSLCCSGYLVTLLTS